jgi:hypothetical protein
MRGPRTLRIGTPRHSVVDGVHRVSADVGGEIVWFESRDLPLVPAPESFASAFLVPAIASGARLESAAPLDPAWMEGARGLVEIFHKWWRYPALAPLAPIAGAVPAAAGETPAPRARGLFFSGGVDSFHALLCCGEQIEMLVLVHGFDIPIDDAPRAEAALLMTRKVAAEVGMRSAFVRTNLRQHAWMRRVAWERTNGGALISVGHVLGSSVHEMLIASSITLGRDKAWGSHWDTDPMFSSSRVRFRQIGFRLRRFEKIGVIANQTLPRHHLRVCWENRSPSGNCSKCGKCLVTRLGFAKCGALELFPVLEGGATLAADLDALPSDSHIHSLAEMCESPALDPEVRRAARALLRRSRHVRTLPVRARRAVIRWLTERSGSGS